MTGWWIGITALCLAGAFRLGVRYGKQLMLDEVVEIKMQRRLKDDCDRF